MSGVGYIGSKISLISRSDIRYVGILHSINSTDSTVALEQVRSYGTEGRRGIPAEEIPPSDNIFEYIVFRGSDVKDLHVCEAPAQQQSLPPQVPNDPAILGTTAPRPPSFQSFAPPPPMGVQPPNFAGAPLNPFYLQQVAAASFQQQPQYWQQPHPQPQLNNNISESTAKEAEQPKSQLQKEHSAPDKVEEPKSDKQSAALKNFVKTGTSSRSTAVTANNRNNEAIVPSTSAVENLAKKVSEINLTTTKEANGEKQVVNNHARSSAPSNNRLPGMGGHLLQQNRRGRGSRRNYNQNYDRNRIPVPQSDFDFESSNAKFNKEEIVKEVVKKTLPHDQKEEEPVDGPHGEEEEEEDILIPPAESYYDRSKSFFDNISCETKERLEQQGPDGRRGLSVAERRQKQSEERRLNLETFGQVSIDGGRYRGGYRGRGYRGGRGGYRGRGGGSGGYRGGYSNNFRGNNYRQQQQPSL